MFSSPPFCLLSSCFINLCTLHSSHLSYHNAFDQPNLCPIWTLWQLSAAPKGRVATKNAENVSRYLLSNCLFFEEFNLDPCVYLHEYWILWKTTHGEGVNCYKVPKDYLLRRKTCGYIYTIKIIKTSLTTWFSFVSLIDLVNLMPLQLGHWRTWEAFGGS